MALELPDEITPAIKDALGVPNFRCAPVAEALRLDGKVIPYRAEDEQAHVLFWFLHLAIRDGDKWRESVGVELGAIAERARAKEAANG